MSAIAMILKENGFSISGYDRTLGEVTDKLESNGIKVYSEFDASQIESCDAIVYSAAFGNDHPIFKAAKDSGKILFSRAEILGAIASLFENSIAIAGTHGKSTTSGMLGHVLLNSESCDPTVVVGAVMRDVGSTYRVGKDKNFVFEACEYKDSFLSFFPRIAVILNVALDHTDYFNGIEHMRNSFVSFINNYGNEGYAIYNYDCENSKICIRDHVGKSISFSAKGDSNANYYAQNIKFISGFASFDVYKNNEFYISLKLSAPGEHNVANSLAVVACCDMIGVPQQDIINGIGTFVGVGRRFEYKGRFCGADVYDDYAHHPDEIKVTLNAAKAVSRGRLIAVFQPHNYSRLLDLFEDFKTSFNDADQLILCPLYAAREASGTEVSSELLSKQIENSVYFETFDQIKEYLKSFLKEDDLLIIMGAGDISKLANDL